MTTALGTCGGCGATEPMGALHVFRGAGIVLRCPHCDTTLVTIVKSATRVWVGMPGMSAFEAAM
jgi:hypothetical protein